MRRWPHFLLFLIVSLPMTEVIPSVASARPANQSVGAAATPLPREAVEWELAFELRPAASQDLDSTTLIELRALLRQQLALLGVNGLVSRRQDGRIVVRVDASSDPEGVAQSLTTTPLLEIIDTQEQYLPLDTVVHTTLTSTTRLSVRWPVPSQLTRVGRRDPSSRPLSAVRISATSRFRTIRPLASPLSLSRSMKPPHGDSRTTPAHTSASRWRLSSISASSHRPPSSLPSKMRASLPACRLTRRRSSPPSCNLPPSEFPHAGRTSPPPTGNRSRNAKRRVTSLRASHSQKASDERRRGAATPVTPGSNACLTRARLDATVLALPAWIAPWSVQTTGLCT